MIYGWDMSHYDAPSIGAALAEGFSFITHKAGGDAVDSELAAWWSGVKDLSLPSGRAGSSGPTKPLLGAYWVLYPGRPAARADEFIARLDAQCQGWRDRPFLLQVDCEIWRDDRSTKPGLADIKAFCDRLRTRLPRLRPVVYASAGQYGSSLTGLGYPLWNARYPLGDQAGTAATLYARCGGDAGKGWAAYSGQTPTIWQFTASATIAGQRTSDANAYRGTLAQLVALVAPGWEDDMAKEDVLEALTEFFAIGKQPAAKGGLPESVIGHAASVQGVPDTIDGGTTYLYQLVGKIGALTKSIAARLDVPVSEVLAAVGDVDDQVLAALADAGRSDEDLAAALRAALGGRAEAVGRLLAGS